MYVVIVIMKQRGIHSFLSLFLITIVITMYNKLKEQIVHS